MLTEEQLMALERAKQEKEAHGEIETEHPDYPFYGTGGQWRFIINKYYVMLNISYLINVIIQLIFL